MHRRLRLLTATVFSLTLGLAGALADPDGRVTHTVNGNTETWRIDEPNVQKPIIEFPEVTFVPGDKVTVGGGGCAQTGGTGPTWKRYVDPLGPDSDTKYHGMVLIPGAIGQLPADDLANFARILIIKGHQFTVGAIDEPRKAHLWLGYEDSDYSDNGYWGQDPGTDGQCQIGGSWLEHAFAYVTIVHGGAAPPPPNVRPFDISVNSITPGNPALDDNLILFNPVWGAQLPPTSTLPNAATCNSNSTNPQDCTSQTTTTDGTALCTVRGWFTGDAGGHVNWAAGTYKGRLYWEAHSSPGTDDDYNFWLVPPDQAGLTSDHGNTPTTREPALGLEFDSDETIDHFTTPWWSKLHAAVDADDKAYAVLHDAINFHFPASAVAEAQAAFDQTHKALTDITDGKTAIAVGLVGLDGAHGDPSELHPVWAMAIQTSDDPGDETWAIFARRWGDEGFCSGDQHYLDDLQGDRITFRLPWRPGATGVTASAGTQFLSRFGQATGPTLSPDPGKGVLVSFTMPVPQSGDGERVNGELHLNWAGTFRATTGVGGATVLRGQLNRALPVGPVHAGGLQTTIQAAESEDPEARVAAAVAGLTQAQRQTYVAHLPPKTPGMDGSGLRASAPVTAVGGLGVRIVVRRPTTRAVPDPQKQARDQQRLAAFRAVSAEAIPLDTGRTVLRNGGVVRRVQ